jgi:hypothetical protein
LPTLDQTRRDQVTVEAETVEEALVEITAQLGEDAEIMRAQKVHRGGVGGFFAKEMVQLTARRRRHSAPPLRPAGDTGGIAGVLERMAQDADAADGDFKTALRRELQVQPGDEQAAPATGSAGEAVPALPNVAESTVGFLGAVGWEDETDEGADPEPTATSGVFDDDIQPITVGPVLQAAPPFPEVEATVADPGLESEHPADTPAAGPVVPVEFPADPDCAEAAAVAGEPVAAAATPAPGNLRPAADAPAGMGAINWGTTALLRLGMPAPVIGGVSELDANDDLAWIEGIAAAVAPHCGALPDGDVIVVGPHAERLAEPLGLPLVQAGDMAPYNGSFCALVEDSVQDRQWLEFVQGGRGIHLVIGDEPWQDLLVAEPVAVSWVGEKAVADALYLAFTLGATLGFGTMDGFVSSMVRAQPTDVALAVRRIVGRR